MEKVRIGVIGTGGMGRAHISYMPELQSAELTAVADIDQQNTDSLSAEKNIPGFYTGEELMDSGLVDAVMISTPHYFHPPLAIEAFKRGLHVLSEKPLGVQKSEVEAAIAEHAKHPDIKFTIMFQNRTCAHYTKLRELIVSGELGDLTRIVWVVTSWFRPQIYYDSGTWRATWKGEGGGVLMNQCPHNLDLWQWIFGLPKRISAHLELGKYHDIEVEDDVTAYMEYENGATGVFITSTGEAPGTDRLEVSGNKGRVVVENGKLEFFRNAVPTDQFSLQTKHSFSHPPLEHNIIHPAQNDGQGKHKTITQNWVAAIIHNEPLIVEGHEGLGATELINAMQLSGIRKRPIDLPLNGADYDALLSELQASSQEKTTAAEAIVDMNASFHA